MKNRMTWLTLLSCIYTITANAADYPTYTPAMNISAEAQVPMEAAWLHSMAMTTQYNTITIPKSFDARDYWKYLVANNSSYQTYREAHDTHDCRVIPGNEATIERSLQNTGLDIYDGAIWQMSLALAAKYQPLAYKQDVDNYQNFLVNGIADKEIAFQSYRAEGGYTYNGRYNYLSGQKAYLLKFISPVYAYNYDAVNGCMMNWPEWSAVTGEEAWAVLIGPVQSIYLLNDGNNNPNWSADTQADNYLQLGKEALGAIQKMQAPSGGVYRNVAMPDQPQDLDISLENNFSLYAGLTMLEQALKQRDHVLSLTASKDVLQSDKDDLQTIATIKNRMVKFFAGLGGVPVYDRDGKYFYASVNGNVPNTKDFAVDVQTWGATVIATNPELLQAMNDSYGPDVMFAMLQNAVTKSGYYDSHNQLLGVGYTAQKASDDFYVMSGEWTLGAVNAAIVLADYYHADADKSSLLISEAKMMLKGLRQETSSLQGSDTSPTSRLSYLYANKRVLIPFGWYANKSPSTASTGWSLMVNSCFNPLELGGGKHQGVCKEVL